MTENSNWINSEELTRYEESVEAFRSNKLDAERFQSMRLQQGVYGQRQEGVHMTRIKIPGGKFTPNQAGVIADILEKYADHDVAHVTTRQAIQVHYIPLKDTPDALQHLASAELTTREACNNTVRNISACPLAGVCPHEHTDVSPILKGMANHFLRHPLTQHLPRKFKASISGCEADCAQGMIHDMGVVAVHKDGKFGYKVLAGGGLGHKPHKAITVEEFIEEADLLASTEAIIALHNRYSDRKRRAKSRIKFLVDRFGAEGFIEKYREEFVRTKAALATDNSIPKADWSVGAANPNCNSGAPRANVAQKQAGLNVVPIRLPLGDITVPQLRGIKTLMESEGLEDIRTTQDQNLMILQVPDDRLDAVTSQLNTLGLGQPNTGDDVVACPGTSTCRLGITSSRIIATKLSGGDADLRIRASGCHNGCAQPETGDIGIYGEGKRKHGKLIPHYQMYIGGDGRSFGNLALKGPTIPSVRIEAAITTLKDDYAAKHSGNESFFQWSQAQGADYFKTLLESYTIVNAEDITEVFHDHGHAEDFRVEQFGGGECAGASQEVVAANFAEAANERNYRNAFSFQRKYDETIECALVVCRLVADSVLFVGGETGGETLSDKATLITSTHPSQSDLAEQLNGFINTLDQLKDNFDVDVYANLAADIDHWTVKSAAFCQQIDPQLDLSASVPKMTTEASDEPKVIDLSIFDCPLHFIKARNILKDHQAGDVLDFLFTTGEATEQVLSSLEGEGHNIIETEDQGKNTLIRVRKAG